MSNAEQYNKLIKMLERQPEFELEDMDNENLTLQATLSIAISLKRIADSLEAPEITPFDIPNLTPEQLFSLQEKWNKGHD